MNLAISGQLLGSTKPFEDILRILKRHGVQAIEVWPQNVPVQDQTIPYQSQRYEGRMIEQVRMLLDRFGMRACCVTMPGAFDEGLSSDLPAYQAALAHTVQAAHMLGAALVNHYCYYLALEEGAALDRFKQAVRPAVETAERLGITLCLENEAHDATQRPEGMLRLLEAIGSPVFKTTFDPCNYYHASVEGYPYAYDVLKASIGYVHIKNGCIYNPAAGHRPESKGAPMTGGHAPNLIFYPPLGEGAVNIDGLLLRLERENYSGYCTLEPHTSPELAEEYYRQEVDYLARRGFFGLKQD